VRAWDHPSAGGPDYGYTLRLFEEKGDPTAQIFPASGSKLFGETIPLQVTAADEASGVNHVEFLWHSGDWETGPWITLGEDWDGQDGWSVPFDLSKIQPQGGLAVYARVYDWAGNWVGAGAWDLMKVLP
jgi:hypothetical protein